MATERSAHFDRVVAALKEAGYDTSRVYLDGHRLRVPHSIPPEATWRAREITAFSGRHLCWECFNDPRCTNWGCVDAVPCEAKDGPPGQLTDDCGVDRSDWPTEPPWKPPL